MLIKKYEIKKLKNDYHFQNTNFNYGFLSFKFTHFGTLLKKITSEVLKESQFFFSQTKI